MRLVSVYLAILVSCFTYPLFFLSKQNGRSAYLLAELMGHSDIADLLKTGGASESLIHANSRLVRSRHPVSPIRLDTCGNRVHHIVTHDMYYLTVGG